MNNLAQALYLVDWEKVVRVLSASLTPTLAVFGAYIAWRQHKISQNQFRLALLERRLKVFDSVNDLIRKVVADGKVELSDLQEFWLGTSQRNFLFPPDIGAYLDELSRKASDVYSLKDATDAVPRKQWNTAVMWFADQLDRREPRRIFGKDMNFKDVD